MQVPPGDGRSEDDAERPLLQQLLGQRLRVDVAVRIEAGRNRLVRRKSWKLALKSAR